MPGVATPARVEVEVRSMLCVAQPPDLLDEGTEEEREVWVRLGPGTRRRLRPGDHIDPSHELVSRYPGNFAPSAELADVVVVSGPSAEVLARRKAEAARLMLRLVQVTTWACENCGTRAEGHAVIPQQVQALDVAAALDGAEDLGERAQVQYHSVRQQQAYLDGQAEERRIFHQFRVEHAQCDPAAQLHPLEPMPALEPGQPIPVWSGPFSFR
jgi:hypothetical protein